MAISTPEPRRRLKLPRKLPRGRSLQPYSRVDAPYFGSPRFYVRIGGLAAIVAAALALLVLRAWSVQVLHGRQYAKAVHQQAFRSVPVLGARGAIVDDKGRLIAGTDGRVVIDADAGSLGTRGKRGHWHPSAAGLQEIGRLARLAGTSRTKLVALIAHDVLQSPFVPAVVIPHPSRALADYLQERPGKFRAFSVEAQASRSYPLGAFGGEFLGLLGQINPQELKAGIYKGAQQGEIVGQSGVEAAYDSILNDGFLEARIPVDSLGRIAGPLIVPKQKQPPTLQLSIDTRLQKATASAVLTGMAAARAAGSDPTGGSAVVMDPWTGAIKAIVSYPTFNEKLAATRPAYLEHLYKDASAPTLNRAIAGVYPTGSTFKPIVAEAALSAGLITPSTSLLCSSSFSLGGTVFNNDFAGFSYLTLPTALEESCDTWFYRLADRIWQADPRRQGTLIQQWARKLGLGTPPPVDLTGASAGYLPMPGAYFEKVCGCLWTEGQAVNLAIGQGALQVSPLQLAVAYSTIVNGGTVVRPHVAAAVIRSGKRHPLHFKPVRRLKLSPYTWAIKQGLYLAAHGSGGTSASTFANFPIPVAGKTGTAQTQSAGGPDHSWYASWAPYQHPRLVVVAMIQNGGYGAQAAAPAVKAIYQAAARLGYLGKH